MSRGFYNKCSIVDYNTDNADYVFDNIGNVDYKSLNGSTNDYTANNLNQYSDIDGTNLTYDADGNMLSNNGWTYTWNGENRLISASNGTSVVSFGYDYMGRRFEKTSGGDTTTFVYDGWNMVRESSATVTNHYVWGLDLSLSIGGAGGVGGLLSVTEDDGSSYYPSIDANGNITGYKDDSTNIVAVYIYDAFGGIIASSKDKADDFKFRFSSKYQDSETSFNYYGYRYYDADLGRWLNRDPIGEYGGLNLYAFVQNRGAGLVDYLGFACCCINATADMAPYPADGTFYTYYTPWYNTRKFGNELKVEWTVDGDPNDCTFWQLESGSGHYEGPVGGADIDIAPKTKMKAEYTDYIGIEMPTGLAYIGYYSVEVNMHIEIECEDSAGNIVNGGSVDIVDDRYIYVPSIGDARDVF